MRGLCTGTYLIDTLWNGYWRVNLFGTNFSSNVCERIVQRSCFRCFICCKGNRLTKIWGTGRLGEEKYIEIEITWGERTKRTVHRDTKIWYVKNQCRGILLVAGLHAKAQTTTRVSICLRRKMNEDSNLYMVPILHRQSFHLVNDENFYRR